MDLRGLPHELCGSDISSSRALQVSKLGDVSGSPVSFRESWYQTGGHPGAQTGPQDSSGLPLREDDLSRTRKAPKPLFREKRGHESGKSAAVPRFFGVHSPAMARPPFSRLLLLALLTGAACAPPREMKSQSPQQRPTLVVMLTVDQFRPDYLTLWEKQFNGGLARLLRGAVFLNG